MFNPFELTGVHFLQFYLLTLAITIPVALLFRLLFRLPASLPEASATDLNPYEMAYILGGQTTGVHAGIAGLIQRKVLKIDAESRQVVRAKELPDNASTVESAIFTVVGGGQTAEGVCRLAKELLRELEQKARDRSLTLSPTQAQMVRLGPVVLMAAVVLIGCIQMYQGYFVRHNPIGYLFVLTLVPLVAGVFFWNRDTHLTLRGARLLRETRRQNSALKVSATRSPRSLAHDDMALAVGLFGIGILDEGPMKGMHTTFSSAPAARSSGVTSADTSTGWGAWWVGGSSCSSWTSSCGGSSCGGGGGCGGGGCGGCGG